MSVIRSRFVFRVMAAVAVTGALLATGCGATTWMSGTSVSRDVRVDVAENPATRTVEKAIPVEHGQIVRLAHLAGNVRLIQADVEHAQLRAEVSVDARSEGETQRLLDAMTWTTWRDASGHLTWTLNWPTDQHQTYHYSADAEIGERGFTVVTDDFYDRKLTVTTQRDSGVPTLFANLTVTYPMHSGIDVRVLAGNVSAETLKTKTAVETGFGDVVIDRVDGNAMIDASTGAIRVRELIGQATLDTGSGDIAVTTMNGGGRFDTGSGNITVDSLVGNGHFDTGSGEIVISQCDSNSIYADTGSGDITIQNGRAERIELDTGSGSITLHAMAFVSFFGDTGSGDVFVHATLLDTERIHADTGSGDVVIHSDPNASFDLTADQGSGEIINGYDGVLFSYDGDEIIGVRRGDGRTRIHVDTGSGDCVIRPFPQGDGLSGLN